MNELVNLPKNLPKDGFQLNDMSIVVCPECGFDYSHITNVFTRLGSDPYEAGTFAGTRAIGCIGFRRSCLVIEFTGECGHIFEWQIQQHKGNNFVATEYVREIPDEVMPPH